MNNDQQKEYEEHFSPDGEYIQYQMENPEMHDQPMKSNTIKPSQDKTNNEGSIRRQDGSWSTDGITWHYPKKECRHEEAVSWNEFNKVVQCHKCGTIFKEDKPSQDKTV